MNEKITAVLTVAIMGIAFWYGLSNNSDSYVNNKDSLELMTIIPEDIKIKDENINQVETKINNDNISTNTDMDTSSIKPDLTNNINSDCTLDQNQTDELGFNDAFKYYRICNGKTTEFVWNNKLFIAAYKEELLESKDKSLNFANKNEGLNIIEVTSSD